MSSIGFAAVILAVMVHVVDACVAALLRVSFPSLPWRNVSEFVLLR